MDTLLKETKVVSTLKKKKTPAWYNAISPPPVKQDVSFRQFAREHRHTLTTKYPFLRNAQIESKLKTMWRNNKTDAISQEKATSEKISYSSNKTPDKKVKIDEEQDEHIKTNSQDPIINTENEHITPSPVNESIYDLSDSDGESEQPSVPFLKELPSKQHYIAKFGAKSYSRKRLKVTETAISPLSEVKDVYTFTSSSDEGSTINNLSDSDEERERQLLQLHTSLPSKKKQTPKAKVKRRSRSLSVGNQPEKKSHNMGQRTITSMFQAVQVFGNTNKIPAEDGDGNELSKECKDQTISAKFDLIKEGMPSSLQLSSKKHKTTEKNKENSYLTPTTVPARNTSATKAPRKRRRHSEPLVRTNKKGVHQDTITKRSLVVSYSPHDRVTRLQHALSPSTTEVNQEKSPSTKFNTPSKDNSGDYVADIERSPALNTRSARRRRKSLPEGQKSIEYFMEKNIVRMVKYKRTDKLPEDEGDMKTEVGTQQLLNEVQGRNTEPTALEDNSIKDQETKKEKLSKVGPEIGSDHDNESDRCLRGQNKIPLTNNTSPTTPRTPVVRSNIRRAPLTPVFVKTPGFSQVSPRALLVLSPRTPTNVRMAPCTPLLKPFPIAQVRRSPRLQLCTPTKSDGEFKVPIGAPKSSRRSMEARALQREMGKGNVCGTPNTKYIKFQGESPIPDLVSPGTDLKSPDETLHKNGSPIRSSHRPESGTEDNTVERISASGLRPIPNRSQMVTKLSYEDKTVDEKDKKNLSHDHYEEPIENVSKEVEGAVHHPQGHNLHRDDQVFSQSTTSISFEAGKQSSETPNSENVDKAMTESETSLPIKSCRKSTIPSQTAICKDSSMNDDQIPPREVTDKDKVGRDLESNSSLENIGENEMVVNNEKSTYEPAILCLPVWPTGSNASPLASSSSDEGDTHYKETGRGILDEAMGNLRRITSQVVSDLPSLEDLILNSPVADLLEDPDLIDTDPLDDWIRDVKPDGIDFTSGTKELSSVDVGDVQADILVQPATESVLEDLFEQPSQPIPEPLRSPQSFTRRNISSQKEGGASNFMDLFSPKAAPIFD